MAVKKIEINEKNVSSLEALNINANLNDKEEFAKVINTLVAKSIQLAHCSNEILFLLENIYDLARKLNKKDDIETLIKESLKKINQEIIEKI